LISLKSRLVINLGVLVHQSGNDYKGLKIIIRTYVVTFAVRFELQSFLISVALFIDLMEF
jgi:hypothetical protein